MDWADKEFDKEMLTPKWDWDTETPRKNGRTVNTPRDIYDLGILFDSKRREQTGTTCTFTWATDYADYVHDGYSLKNGVQKPARPWTQSVVSQIGEIVGISVKKISGVS